MRHLMLTTTAALTLLAASQPALAADITPGYAPNLALALKGGVWQADSEGVDAGPAYGIEASMDDALIHPFAGKLRDMLSLNHVDHDGLEMTTLEFNSHWVFEARPNLWIGAGPGIGYVWSNGRENADGIGLNLGGSATYMVGHALIGLESRYQWTPGNADTDNWLTMVKVGWVF